MDLDDLHEANEDLADAVKQNTRRYTNMVSDIVYEMLPDYKHREVMLLQLTIVFIKKKKYWKDI